MKIALTLVSLLAAGNASAAFPITEAQVKAPLVSADAVGPHRTTSARTIGLVHGLVAPEYLARVRGCVLKQDNIETLSLALGEPLNPVSQTLRAEKDRNCLKWEQSVGGDDFCSIEGRPLEALSLEVVFTRMSGAKIALQCRILNTQLPSDMEKHVQDSLGNLISIR